MSFPPVLKKQFFRSGVRELSSVEVEDFPKDIFTILSYKLEYLCGETVIYVHLF